MEYPGTYKDKFGIKNITVKNDFETVSFRLGEFNFSSSNFVDFELENYKDYAPEQINRFTFKSFIGYGSNIKFYELNEFEISFTVPVNVLNIKTNEISAAHLSFKIDIGLEWDSMISLKLVYNKKDYSGRSEDFEGAAGQINKQVNGEFVVKNCFWCLYSDYGVAGNPPMGAMICYLKHKDKYLKVKGKAEYMELPKEDIAWVQEIYCCDSFQPRRPGVGYRG